MTALPPDLRTAAWIGAWDRIEQAQKIKEALTPKNRVAPEPLPDLYWSMIAEAQILADLARASDFTGRDAGAALVDRERIARVRRDNMSALLDDLRSGEDICATCHAHHDKHSNDDLSCPSHTMPNGDIVFSTTHRYTDRTKR